MARSFLTQKSENRIQSTGCPTAKTAKSWQKIDPKCSTIVEDPLQIGPFMQNKANFRKSQMSVNPYNIKDYEKISDWTLGENKPNSKPIKANLHFTAENAECAEKKDISVSYCSIERYALYHISPRSLRTRRLMKNKAKTKPILERMNVNFCATGYYESKPAIRVAGKPTFAVRQGRPNNPNVEITTAGSCGARIVAQGG